MTVYDRHFNGNVTVHLDRDDGIDRLSLCASALAAANAKVAKLRAALETIVEICETGTARNAIRNIEQNATEALDETEED